MVDKVLDTNELRISSTFSFSGLTISTFNQIMANGDFSPLAYSLSRVRNNSLSARTSEVRIPNVNEAKKIFADRVREIYPDWFQVESEPLESSEE